MSVYAKWTANKYTVKFDNGSTQNDVTGTLATISAAFDTNVSLLKNPYKRTGFTFRYLLDSAKNATYSNISTMVINNNFGYDDITDGQEITLKAQWKEHEYKVVYNANVPNGTYITNGIPAITTASHTYTQNWTLNNDIPTMFEVEGYVFNKFTDTISGSSPKVTFGYAYEVPTSYGLTDNQTYYLYAQWIKNPYYVDFVGGGAPTDTGEYAVKGSMNRQTMEVDTNAALYKVSGGTGAGEGFTYLGHSFAYWQDNNPLPGKKSTYSNAEIVNNIRTDKYAVATLTAIWNEYTYDINFASKTPLGNVLEGNKDNITGVKFSEEVNLGTAGWTIKGYNFSKWIGSNGNEYTENQNVKRLEGSTRNGKSIKLTAQWTPATYSIAFDKNLGDSSISMYDTSKWVASKRFTYDQKFSLVDGGLPTQAKGNIARPGFEFKGWTLAPVAANMSTTSYVTDSTKFRPESVTPDANGNVMTLYAHWIPVVYTLYVRANNIDGVNGLLTTNNKNYSSSKVNYGETLKDYISEATPSLKLVA